MVSLLDLAPLRKKVPLRGQEIEFRPLSLKYLVTLLAESDELRTLLAEKALDATLASKLVIDLPDIVAQCIAAASGKPGDADTVGFVLLELSPGEWLTCLEVIFELTFPQGIANFIAALSQAMRNAGIDVPGWEQGTKSPEPSSDVLLAESLPRPLGSGAPGKSEPTTNSSEEKATAETSG